MHAIAWEAALDEGHVPGHRTGRARAGINRTIAGGMPAEKRVVVVPVIVPDHMDLRYVDLEVGSGIPLALDQHRVARDIRGELSVRDERRRPVPSQSAAIEIPGVQM